MVIKPEAVPQENSNDMQSFLHGNTGHQGMAGFTEIFNTYYARLRFYAGQFVPDKATADDIVQDCFYKLWYKRHEIILHGNLAAYLYTMVRYATHNYLQFKYRETHAQELEDLVDDNRLQETIAAETMNHIFTLSNALHPKTRQVFKLLFRDGMEHAEAARTLGISESTLRTQKAIALNFLRQHLGKLIAFFLNLFFFH